MKKILSAVVLLVGLNFSGHSQVLISLLFGDKLNSDGLEFGLEGGYNWASISGLESSRGLGKFNLGLYFDIRLKNSLYLYTGVLVKSTFGTNRLSDNDLAQLDAIIYDEEGTYSQNIEYFMMPFLLNYKFKNRVYVEAGPQVSYMRKAWIEYNSEFDDSEATIKQYNTDDINRFNFGFIVGTGFKLKPSNGLTVGLKYNFGLTDVYKDISGTQNNVMFLKFNIPIGAGKAAERRAEKEQAETSEAQSN